MANIQMCIRDRLTSVLGRDANINSAVLHEEGVINTASAIVGYDKRYEGIINHLLGRIIVTENIDSALRLAKKYKYSLRIVTLDGELLNPGGALSGGAYKNAGNLLGRKMCIRDRANYFGTMLVKMGIAHALLGGATYSTADTVRPALQLIKTKPGNSIVSSCFIMVRPAVGGNEVLAMGDCAINIKPTEDEMCIRDRH